MLRHIDLDDLLAEILALQQAEECLGHSLDSGENIFFVTNFPCLLPGDQALQCFIPPMPPVKNQETVNAGPGDDQVAHESFADVGLAEPTGKRHTAADHDACANTQIFHHRIMNGTGSVVEEDIDAIWAGILHCSSKVGGLF